MVKPTPSAAMHNVSPPGPMPLLELARDQLSWRPYFQDSSAEEQEAEVQQEARGLAIAASEIGEAAERIDAAMGRLVVEVRQFLKRWPNDDSAETAANAAITAAGLNPHPDSLRTNNSPECFQDTPAELRTWLPVLTVIRERLESVWPIAIVTGNEGSNASERRGK